MKLQTPQTFGRSDKLKKKTEQFFKKLKKIKKFEKKLKKTEKKLKKLNETPMTVSNFGDFYNGALKVFETVCLRTSAHPTMCANDILLQTRNTSDDDDDLFNQPLLVYISASRSLIDEPKKRNFIRIQFRR